MTSDDTEIRFADVESAMRASDRYRWILPVIDGTNAAVGQRRHAALQAAFNLGLRGDAMVGEAMRNEP